MKCYLCSSENLLVKNQKTRDRNIRVLECKECTLTFLESFDHLDEFSYEDSQNNYEQTVTTKEEYLALLKGLSEDDERRAEQHKHAIKDKTLLDFGCGAGGFLLEAKKLAKRAVGVEVDSIVRFYASEIEVKEKLEDLHEQFDVITLFHVIEHIPDPISLLKKLKKFVSPGGRVIIEVPNDHDALLTYYNSQAFRDFTYWSLHLFSFNKVSLEKICNEAGYTYVKIDFFQRYTLGNHMGWLKNGKPGGHTMYTEMNDAELNRQYADQLRDIDGCDTLIATLEV